jgi:hypothetical protein
METTTADTVREPWNKGKLVGQKAPFSDTLGALLAPEFREFGSSGCVYDAASTLDVLVPGGCPRIMLEDFMAASVAEGVVLMTYLSRSVAGPEWKPPALRSSLWTRRASGWQMVFHQGTRLPAEEA